MHKLLLTTLLLALCCAYSCREEQDDNELEDEEWRLITIAEGAVPATVPANVVITATFEAGQLTGNGACNDYQASYTATDPQLSIAIITATKLSCPDLDWEKRYFELLPTSQSWKIDGDILTVQCAEASLVFEEQ